MVDQPASTELLEQDEDIRILGLARENAGVAIGAVLGIVSMMALDSPTSERGARPTWQLQGLDNTLS
ncbi:MAG: hypothetical protein JXC32_15195 [Anaerolineae bacterium]|nr:hypothetical protein [Anaerolineae bacterium]